MNTLEIEILRRELLRDILNVDDVDVLKKIRRSLDRLRVRHVNVGQDPDELRPYMEKPRDFDPFGQTGFAHLWLQYD